MKIDPEVERAADSFQLALPRMPAAGRAGDLLGRGTGSSLEFQEFREYIPGDDIRHIDWGAYARSDTLMVRLYREEISPRTEILLDASRSMTTGGGGKERLARQLAGLFALLSGRVGGRPQVTALDDQPPQALGLDSLDRLASLPFAGRTPLDEMIQSHQVRFQRQSIRVVISDFLFPHDAQALVRRLANEASALWMIQLLAGSEAEPAALGGRRLIDIESGSECDLAIDRHSIAAYLGRLRALQDELQRSCRRAHATFVSLISDRGLLALCRDDLCSCGMLRVVA